MERAPDTVEVAARACAPLTRHGPGDWHPLQSAERATFNIRRCDISFKTKRPLADRAIMSTCRRLLAKCDMWPHMLVGIQNLFHIIVFSFAVCACCTGPAQYSQFLAKKDKIDIRHSSKFEYDKSPVCKFAVCIVRLQGLYHDILKTAQDTVTEPSIDPIFRATPNGLVVGFIGCNAE
jgi:hypothetical protein